MFENIKQYQMIKNILQKLGCTPKYSAVIVRELIESHKEWKYSIKFDLKTYRIFGIKLFSVKL